MQLILVYTFLICYRGFFGDVKENIVHIHTHDRASGILHLEKARVRWFLSINFDTLPEDIKQKGQRTYRSITMEGKEIEFSGGFTELHTTSYHNILNGEGFAIEETKNAIEIVHDIRNIDPIGLKGDYHPFAKKTLAEHPFKK